MHFINNTTVFNFIYTSSHGFAFNGQEKDQEIYNNQSTTTAMFWEYDGRIGRRWNRDPVVRFFESPYATYGNNPILRFDKNGDDWWVNDQGFYLWSDNDEESNGFKYAGLSLLVQPDHYQILTRINGSLYHLHTTNLLAKIGNYFGGNFVEHKPYDHSEESLNEEIRGMAYGLAAGYVIGKVVGVIGKSSLAKRSMQALSASVCFVKNTKVLTVNGYKFIQDIEVGDTVITYNIELNAVGRYRVNKTFKNITNKLVKIETAKSIIYTTEEHLFFINKKTVSANELKASDFITNIFDGFVVVKSQRLVDTCNVEVYNIEVDSAHTYCITEEDILVHNSCNLKWMSPIYGKGKHILSSFANKWTRELSWKDVVKGTVNRNAVYKGTTREVFALEAKALQEGVEIPMNKGSKYFVYEAKEIIGATSGQETKFLRVELNSAGEFHGHPITASEAASYLEKVKK